MTTRARIVQVARGYVGTPFHHRGRLPGIGLDCAGVAVCLGRELGLLPADFDVPAYNETPAGWEVLLWCDQHLRAVPREAMQPGDVLVTISDKYPEHVGILGDYRHGGLSLIQASRAAHPPRVIETRLMFSRAQRFAACYEFRDAHG